MIITRGGQRNVAHQGWGQVRDQAYCITLTSFWTFFKTQINHGEKKTQIKGIARLSKCSAVRDTVSRLVATVMGIFSEYVREISAGIPLRFGLIGK